MQLWGHSFHAAVVVGMCAGEPTTGGKVENDGSLLGPRTIPSQ